MSRYTHKKDEGFTLIELIVVITIIGILATTVVVNVFGRTDQAKVAKVQADFSSIKTAARMFREDHGRWPDSLEELVDPPTTDNGLMMEYLDNLPEDPWSKEFYYYEMGDRGPLLISWGADMTEGGDEFDADIYSDGERY
ncbi:MAG: type II secretion system major pseudopilin GspG [Planctomycetota bacterium]